MIVIITGVSGIGIGNCVNKFIKNFKEFYTTHPERKPLFLKLDNEIEEYYYSVNPHVSRSHAIWIKEILQKPYPLLESYWKEAFQNIFKKITDKLEINEKEVILLNVTACYYHPYTQEFFSLVNIDDLKRLNPDKIITFIDDIYEIQHRLRIKETGIDHQQTLTPMDVIFKLMRYLDWRSKEIMMSRFLANQLPTCERNYIFAVKHPFQSFSNLLFENMKKVYLSHPITEIRNLEVSGKKDKVINFKKDLNTLSSHLTENTIAFLPTTIDEYRIKKNLSSNSSEHFQPILLNRWDKELYTDPSSLLYINDEFNDANELWRGGIENENEIPQDLDSLLTILHSFIGLQVTTRDLSLVEQSDYLVIYRPFFNGKLSTGVSRELKYFLSLKALNKPDMECFVYSPQSDLDAFFVREFRERLNNEIKTSKNLKIKGNGTNLDSFSVEENKKIIVAAGKSDKFLLLDILSSIIDNHNIIVNIRDNTYPLQDNPVQIFKDEYVENLLKTYNVMNNFRNAALYVDNENENINDFFGKIYKYINNGVI
jgi:hypothetical protein